MSENKIVLVTGGAGYVGSHVCKELEKRGHTPVVFDNFSTGHEELCKFGSSITGDVRHFDDVSSALATHKFDAVVHCAALATVNEDNAIEDYYDNNVAGTLNVLRAMREWEVGRIVYVSTAASHESLYGSTKRTAERIVTSFYHKYGINYGILRLQNVAGASPNGDIGERHEPETHLIPNACLVALGKKDKLTLYDGGTAQRDYVHVVDVAGSVCDAVESEKKSSFSMVSSGILRSARSVVEMVEMVSGNKINIEYAGARKGDATSATTADPDRPPRNIDEIIRSALAWHRK